MNANEAARALGNVYAKALLELAADAGKAEVIREDLTAIKQFTDENTEMLAMMSSPWFSRSQKVQVLSRLFHGRIESLTLDFLMVAAEHDRLRCLPEMIAAYAEQHDARKGLQVIRATVSETASVNYIQYLMPKMAESLGAKVRLEVAVDPSILGGVVIRCGERVIDNSVRTRLHRAISSIMERQDNQG